MEQNSLIFVPLVVNNLSQREQTRELFGKTFRKMFTARIAAIRAENVSADTGGSGLVIITTNTSN